MSLFLHIDGIQGEASDNNFSSWLDIGEAQWGISRKISSNTSTQGDRESANAVISDLKIKRFQDKASPQLFIEACCGTGKQIKLVQTKTGNGDGSQAFIEHTLHNALLSRYHISAINQNGTRPIEELTISFVKIESKYSPYDEDGNITAPIAVGFDTASNTKL